MAQLKVKQISDFVTAVGTIHNATVGNAATLAISTAKTEAISTAEAKDVLRASTAVVNISTAKSEAISTAEAKDVLRASTAVVNISTAKSEAISSAVSADVVVLSSAKSYSDIQKLRIDALLLNSTDALDTFAEIENFITSLDTADVSGLSTAISTAESKAISTAVSADVVVLSSAKSYADVVGTDAIAAAARAGDLAYDVLGAAAAAEGNANTYTDQSIINLNLGDIITRDASDFATADQGTNADTAHGWGNHAGLYDAIGAAATALVSAKSYADTAESDAIATAKSYTDTEIATLDADLQGQINALAGVNSDEVIATFVGKTSFDAGRVFNLNGHVAVFVNGLQIHEAGEGIDGWNSADGQLFTVAGLGYDLESSDHIVVSGQVA